MQVTQESLRKVVVGLGIWALFRMLVVYCFLQSENKARKASSESFLGRSVRWRTPYFLLLVALLGFLVYLPPSGPNDQTVPTPLVPVVLGTVVILGRCPLNGRDSNAQ